MSLGFYSNRLHNFIVLNVNSDVTIDIKILRMSCDTLIRINYFSLLFFHQLKYQNLLTHLFKNNFFHTDIIIKHSNFRYIRLNITFIISVSTPDLRYRDAVAYAGFSFSGDGDIMNQN